MYGSSKTGIRQGGMELLLHRLQMQCITNCSNHDTRICHCCHFYQLLPTMHFHQSDLYINMMIFVRNLVTSHEVRVAFRYIKNVLQTRSTHNDTHNETLSAPLSLNPHSQAPKASTTVVLRLPQPWADQGQDPGHRHADTAEDRIQGGELKLLEVINGRSLRQGSPVVKNLASRSSCRRSSFGPDSTKENGWPM